MKEYTKDEISKHNSNDDLWIIIHNKVYDVSGYIKHPGGKEMFYDYAGGDASKAFDDEGHSKAAIEEMKEFCIGAVKDEEEEVIVTTSSTEKKEKMRSRSKIKLISKRELESHNKLTDMWIAVNGFVYDVTKFQHPGGRDKFVTRAGTDCTEDFDKVGHKNADKEMENLRIGRYYDNENYPKEEENGDMTKYLIFGSVVLILGVIGYKIFNRKD